MSIMFICAMVVASFFRFGSDDDQKTSILRRLLKRDHLGEYKMEGWPCVQGIDVFLIV